MNDITLCKVLFLTEHLGGACYERFAKNVDHGDIAGVFTEFAGDENVHAQWYAGWLQARGIAVPSVGVPSALVLPGVNMYLGAQSLDRKLRTFSATEAMAARHLKGLARKAQDPELVSIIERTIPSELEHAEWYGLTGRKMLRPSELG